MNIKDIAKLANISKSTVSRVINNDPKVHKDTREKILQIIKNESFIPNNIAKSLKTKKTKVIGILVPDIGNPFYYEILRGIESLLDKNNFNMMLCNTEYDSKKELKYISLLMSKKVDGIIIAPSSSISKGVNLLYEKNIPFVVLDIIQDYIKTNCVLVNHFKVSYSATSYLLKNGHKEIFILDAYRENKSLSNFRNGFIEAMKENKILIKDYYLNEASPDIIGGYKTLKKIINSKYNITAIITICDLAAVGVYKAAKELGVTIPDDISVIGNDDIPLARYLNPSLTTTRQPKFKLGYKSAEILLDCIKNENFNKENVKIYELDTKLMIRDSIKRRI
ncbi:MAG: LacI family transcriptional regulator [Actinobacteria bacterium]|nr:LacI family transcriptional regulator [Actinomycetota bacterium]